MRNVPSVMTLAAALLIFAGCEDFKQAMEGGPENKPSASQTTAPKPKSPVPSPVGKEALSGQQPAAGPQKPSTPKPSQQQPQSTAGGQKEVAQAGNSSSQGRTGSRVVPRSNFRRHSSIVGKTTAKVVDAQKALKNPNIVVVENKVTGNDPFTVAASAYVSMAARASTFGFQRALQLFKATNGRNPTYKEFLKMMKENHVEFAALPPYRMYGYDEKTGGIVILEDKELKAKLYKEHGIPQEK